MIKNVSFIKPNGVVSLFGKPYRILFVNREIAILIELEIEKFHIEVIDLSYLINLDSNKLKEEKDIYYIQHNEISIEVLEKITMMAKDIELIIKSIHPNYFKLYSKEIVPELKSFQEMYGLSPKNNGKLIRRYLQSGRDMYALVDMRMFNKRPKSITKDKTQEKYFKQAFNKFINGDLKSVKAAYDDMIINHYSDVTYDEENNITAVVPLPKNLRPSEQKFRRFVNEQLGNLSVAAAKKSSRERLNNDRIRIGDAQTGCAYPGDIVEIDACEIDLIAVSETHQKHGIGRPVIYFVIDVFSRAIIGYYVGLENNSFMGASSLFANMFFSNKPHYRNVEGMKEINITPGGIIPNIIRVDHGSEWISKDIRRLGKECNIDITIVPPAQGSYKGLVESSFRSFQEGIGNIGSKFGAIYQEYDSKHYDTASLILTDIKNIIEEFIVKFNQKELYKFTLTRKMSEKGVHAIPCELWDYGINYCGNPRYVTENQINTLVFALCKPCEKDMKSNISLEGITVKGLKYICKDRLLIDLIEQKNFKKKKIKYEARYDPRLVDYIWIKTGNEILKVPLASKRENQMTYAGLTWFEYNLFFIDNKDNRKNYQEINDSIQLTYIAKAQQIMKNSKERQKLIPGKNVKSDVTEHRLAEREIVRKESALVNQIETKEENPQITDNTTTVIETNDVINYSIENKDKIQTLVYDDYLSRFMWEDEED